MTANSGTSFYKQLISMQIKPINLEEINHKSREVMINDLFLQVKDLVIYLNTNIVEITDMSKEMTPKVELPSVAESVKQSMIGGLLAQKKEGSNGSLAEKFGKLFM